MSGKAQENKRDLARLILAMIENDCVNREQSEKYLASIGMNPSKVAEQGAKKIKQLLLQAKANKTDEKMRRVQYLRAKAEEFVNKLLNEPNFSFPNFIKEENLSVSFRNVENITTEDKKRLMIKHFMLKLEDELNNSDSNNNNERSDKT